MKYFVFCRFFLPHIKFLSVFGIEKWFFLFFYWLIIFQLWFPIHSALWLLKSDRKSWKQVFSENAFFGFQCLICSVIMRNQWGIWILKTSINKKKRTYLQFWNIWFFVDFLTSKQVFECFWYWKMVFPIFLLIATISIIIPYWFRIITTKIRHKIVKTRIFKKSFFWVPVLNLFGHNAKSVGNMDLKNIHQ